MLAASTHYSAEEVTHLSHQFNCDVAGSVIPFSLFAGFTTAMGIDPVWFGILFVINMEIGYMTPPFGFNLFYLKGVVPPSITMKDIYVSVIPFVLVEIVGLALIMIFPEIATYLPDLMF